MRSPPEVGSRSASPQQTVFNEVAELKRQLAAQLPLGLQPELTGVPVRGAEFKTVGEQALFELVVDLQQQLVDRDRQLAAARQEVQEAQAELDRLRAPHRAPKQRRKEQHPEEARQKQAGYECAGYAPQGQLDVAQAKLDEYEAKQEHQRKLRNARQQRYRQRHPEETRQRKREERDRARKRPNPPA